MIIDSSAVVMSSERTFVQKEEINSVTRRLNNKKGEVESETLATSKTSAKVENSKDYLVSLNDSDGKGKNLVEEKALERLKKMVKGDGMDLARLPQEHELSLIEQLLNAMDMQKGNKPRFQALHNTASSFANMRSMMSAAVQMEGAVFSSAKGHGSSGASQAAFVYSQTTFQVEAETTDFAATGIARTKDGREIQFNVNVSMTREFMQKTGFFAAQLTEDGKLVDPLVINIDSDVASIRDQTFTFDIDADGTAEEISRLGPGSGFLALDKNGDGVINDGSELFGAKTGNGFAELAEYDEDGNGWIDENDSVFNNLKVWVQDENGTDRLVGLAQAGVGAIYLGSADTDFSMTQTNASNADAIVRRTGVYLKESGQVGTIQHLDFVV